MKKATITEVTLDEARELYNSGNETLKELALKCFSENELSEKVEEIATEIVTKTLKEEFEAETVEGSIQIETFTYDIWIDVMFEKNKITYACETSHNGRRYDCDDFRDSVANRQTRNTFKGLVNYIKRFEDR